MSCREAPVPVIPGRQGVQLNAVRLNCLESCLLCPAKRIDNGTEQSEFDFQGSSIINLSFTNGTSTYCCGTPVGSGNGNEVVCPYNYDSFELDDSHILAGYAALADYTTSNTTSNPSTDTSSSSNSPSQTPTAATNINSHDVALGAGLGVPLGIVALGSLLWALWERRRANKLSKAMMHSSGSGHGLFGSDKSPQMRLMTESSAPTELDSGRRIQELPGSH